MACFSFPDESMWKQKSYWDIAIEMSLGATPSKCISIKVCLKLIAKQLIQSDIGLLLEEGSK